MELKLVQPEKAFTPIVVRLSGVTIQTRFVAPAKPDAPISVMPSPSVALFMEVLSLILLLI